MKNLKITALLAVLACSPFYANVLPTDNSPVVRMLADAIKWKSESIDVGNIPQGKPKVIQTVVAQCQSDHGAPVRQFQRRSIEKRARQMSLRNDGESVALEQINRDYRAIVQPARAFHLFEKIRSERRRIKIGVESLSGCALQHARLPR